MRNTNRVDRVGHSIQAALSEIFQFELNDPRLPGIFTVRHVKVSKDLRHADIFYSQLPDDDESMEATEDFLERSGGYIRHLLAEKLNMKFTPDLRFIFDESERDFQKINEKLHEIKEKEGR